MRKWKNILFFGSVGLVVLAVGFVSLLDANRPEDPSDIRAKAGVSATIKFTGVVSSVDESQGVIIVENLAFENADSQAAAQKTLGTWTVTPPPSFNLLSVAPGTTILLTVIPNTVIASSRTMSATAITIVR